MKPDASPGMPLMLIVKENRDVRGDLAVLVVEIFVQRLFRLFYCSSIIEVFSSADLLSFDLADPIKIFVKEEPHTIKKLQQGRIRVISSVSLIDQMVERFCFQFLNKTEALMHRYLPMKPGMSATDEGLAATYDYVQEHVNPPISLDVSAWDWSMQAYEFAADYIYRRRVSKWNWFVEHVAFSRVRCLMLGAFVCSNKAVLFQTRPGIQKSGSLNTASTNSHVAVMLAYRAGATGACAMGDDCLATGFKPEEAIALYAALGKKIQLIPTDGSLFSFCSTTWYSRTNAVPENVGKMIYNYLTNSDVDRANSILNYKHELRHLPDDLKYLVYNLLESLLPDVINGIPAAAYMVEPDLAGSDETFE